MSSPVTSIVVAGLGGQGVLKSTDVLAEAVLRAGYDVKKSEIKGMSQRGGSVASDVRFGERVLSPMVPAGEADYLLVLAADQVEAHRHLLSPNGVLITPESVDAARLTNRKSLNVALLGRLSAFLPVPEESWAAALEASFPQDFHEANRQAFQVGREPEAATTTP